MKVLLASVGNPDFRQDPNKQLYGCERNKWVQVNSFKEASEAVKCFIDRNSLGGGNWSGGDIIENGEVIAYVSYNGRVWEVTEDNPKWSSEAKEILI